MQKSKSNHQELNKFPVISHKMAKNYRFFFSFQSYVDFLTTKNFAAEPYHFGG